ncbi:MAG: universal stress protein [Pirellulaceae bacterium]|nr:universal stress protein [Pirellulaceae bacterium]
MKRFKNILLVYPCDQATLDRATSLAQNNHARLKFIRVERELTGTSLITAAGSPAIELQDLVIKEYQSQLKDVVAPVKKEGVRVSTKVVIGTPFLEIIREVIVEKHDLMIMTAEGHGGLKERLFGSTSLHLMRKCPCPLWVMKPTKRKRFLRIMAAVDPEPFDDSRNALNALILQLAASLAHQDSAELHVAHAWTMVGESLLRGPGRFTEPEIQGYFQEEMRKHHELLNTLIAEHIDGIAKVHMVKGLAEFVIPDLAKSEKVDLLVMGTVCRTGIPGFFIGNTAEKILDEVDCSVLTVKPDAFQSPVKFD